jgi:SNF2-related domain
VGEIMTADIVIVNFTVLCSDKYYTRLARFAGRNPKSMPAGKKGGRYFNAVYDSCLEGISARVKQLKVDCASTFEGIDSDAREGQEKEARKAEEESNFRLDGKKAVYKSTGKGTGKKSTKVTTENWSVEKTEVDPWKLKGQKDYSKMNCPPLEMFHWRRLVVDEFTYLLDKADRQRPLAVVQRLAGSCRWFLSGTPKHETFDDIKCLANLLNVHLGIDEVLPGSKVTKSSESTAAEDMSQFLEVKSLQWHERRHKKAQDFLDRFVRQNIAEIDEIPGEEIKIQIDLNAVERIIYLELETFLRSLEMNAQTAKMSKKKSQSDREDRMQKVTLYFGLCFTNLLHPSNAYTCIAFCAVIRSFEIQVVLRKRC